MKKDKQDQGVIFIRTDKATKEELIKTAKKTYLDQNTLGELLIKKGIKKINKKQSYEPQKPNHNTPQAN